MIKAEIIKMIKSYKSWIIFAILMLFAIVCSIDAIVVPGYGNPHPVFMGLLSNNNDIPYGRYFKWLMPIFLIIGYCDKYVTERKHGVANIYITKYGRQKYFWSKIASSFIVPYILCGIPIISNFILNIILLHGGNGFFGMEKWTRDMFYEFEYYQIKYPYPTYIIYIFLALFVFGLLGIFCQSIVFILKDTKTSLIVSFAIWILYFSPKICIGAVMLPYGDDYLPVSLIVILFFLPAVIIPLIIAYIDFVKKKDNI